MMSTTTDAKRGLYRKYEVERTDGSGKPGGKHAKCAYYVLDLVHDKHAAAAIEAYAASCEAEFPKLAKDLRALDVGNQCDHCGGDGTDPGPNCGCHEAACPHALTFPGPCPKCKGWGIARKRVARTTQALPPKEK